MTKPLIIGNWKMHGCLESNQTRIETLLASVEQYAGVDVVVLPPFVYLAQMAALLEGTPLAFGAQTMSEEEGGAFTGEVSAAMLQDLRCQYVLLGHSERRQYYGESNEKIVQKFIIARKFGLTPVLCVGESLLQREAHETFAVIKAQIQCIIDGLGVEALLGSVIAYEPVWAIGTGRSATPNMAQEVHAFIREYLVEQHAEVGQSIPLLYGGSVKPDNAQALFAMQDIQGGLIGGASLQAEAFMEIIHAASTL